MEEFRVAVQTNIRDIYNPLNRDAPKESTPILCNHCGRPGLKPNTVLFGTSLPNRVWKAMTEDFPGSIDIMIVAGDTSQHNIVITKQKKKQFKSHL